MTGLSFHYPTQLCYIGTMSTRHRGESVEAYKARRAAIYRANAAKVKTAMNAAYAADREKYRARKRAARAVNPDKHRAYAKARRDADIEKYRASLRARRAADPAKWRAHDKNMYVRHAQKIKERHAQPAYMAKARAKASELRAMLLAATPPWSETQLIAAFYAACPPGAEVDHWMPLRGRTVRGLHVLANLQYLSKAENRCKRNKFPHDTLPPFVEADWIRLMLARFYAAQSGQEALAA